MISIHLRRTGAKKDPHYRVVVADSRDARDGAFIEVLGHYHPRFEPAKVVLDVEKTKAWIDKGAQPSDTVKSLLRKVETGALDVEQASASSRYRAATEATGAAEPNAAAPEPAPAAEVEAGKPEAAPAPDARPAAEPSVEASEQGEGAEPTEEKAEAAGEEPVEAGAGDSDDGRAEDSEEKDKE